MVEHVYDRFRLPLAASTVDVMRAYLVANPRGAHGPHRYSLETFGLRAANVAETFGSYRARRGYRLR